MVQILTYQGSLQHYSQRPKMGATQESTDREWINTNATNNQRSTSQLLKVGKFWNALWLAEPWRQYAKWNQSVTKWQIVYGCPYMRPLEQSERQKVGWWVPGAGGGKNGELVVNGCGAPIWEHEVLEMDSWNSFTTMQMSLMLMNW